MSVLPFKTAARIDASPHDRLWPSSRGFPGEADPPASFDLRQTIDRVAAEVARRIDGRNLTLQVRYALSAPRMLFGHGDRIRQVMMKLFLHATALTPRGRVVVDVQGDECPDGHAAMRLRVEVTGFGIQGERLADGKEPVSALADCRRLVELMGGRLGAITDPERGSFVWLAMKLPVDASHRRHG